MTSGAEHRVMTNEKTGGRLALLLFALMPAQVLSASTVQECVWTRLGIPPVSISTVTAMVVFDDGSGEALYVAGNWFFGSVPHYTGLARWDGSSWTGFNDPSVDLIQVVDSLAVFDDGSGPALYVGGNFTTAGGTEVNRIARWNGTGWSPLAGEDGIGVNGRVRTLTVFDDGTGPALYAGGEFTTAGGVTANRIARWNGKTWTALIDDVECPFPPGCEYNGVSGVVSAMEVFDDGTGPSLYVGGGFLAAGASAANRIAKWDGVRWSALTGEHSVGVSNPVEALVVFDDGSGPALYVGGYFGNAGGVPVNRIAKWNGAEWSALTGPEGMGVNAFVYAMHPFDTGSGPALYVGGTFSEAGGVTARGIARWNGSMWSALDSADGSALGSVYALADFDDGNGSALYAGGSFEIVGGILFHNTARWSCESLVDSDGDGIPDQWEALGVPYIDQHGNPQRYLIPGADPMRKDIFVEIDVMDGAPFSMSSLEAVRDAFAAAPVTNPDGSEGITLHTLVDETSIPHVPVVSVADLPIYHSAWFSTEGERSHPDAAALLQAKSRVFRHCVFYDRLEDAGDSLLGYAAAIHANYFAVSLGSIEDPTTRERFLASAFMHELGHALGLEHGGHDNVNYKPNYVSVMNYNHDVAKVIQGMQYVLAPLDYSRETIATLDESNLDENTGVPTTHYSNYALPHSYEGAQGNVELAWVLLGGSPHDWNQSGPPEVYESSVAVDLNQMPPGNPLHLAEAGPSPCQELEGSSDWGRILYAPPSMHWRGACPDCASICRLSAELIEWHEKNIPPPPPVPGVCRPDMNGDGVLDLADIVAFITAFSANDPTADFNGDGVFDLTDIVQFVTAFMEGCP